MEETNNPSASKVSENIMKDVIEYELMLRYVLSYIKSANLEHRRKVIVDNFYATGSQVNLQDVSYRLDSEFIKGVSDIVLNVEANDFQHYKQLGANLRSPITEIADDILAQEMLKLKNGIELLQQKLEVVTNENNRIKELLFAHATAYDDSKTTQTIPIDIYIDTNDPNTIFEVYDSVNRFIVAIGFVKAFEFDAVKGSWYKRLLGMSYEKLTSSEVTDRLKEVEYGVEVNTILKQQSEIDKNQSEALVNIITSLKDIPNAAIRIGALIVVKFTDESGAVSLQTRTLSIKELHLLNKKPELLQMPKQILIALAKEIDDGSSTSEN